MNKLLAHRAAKPVLFVAGAAAVRAAALRGRADATALGANPAEALIRGTGDWTLRFLCLTLAVTPLRQWTGWHALARFRRMLGLFTFFYVAAALPVLRVARHGLLARATSCATSPKRPFILVGIAGAAADDAAGRHLVQPRDQGARARHAGRRCTARCMPSRCSGCCTSSGCARRRTTSRRWSIYAAVLRLLLGWRLLKAVQRRAAQRMKPGSQSASGWNSSTTTRATTSAATNSHTPRKICAERHGRSAARSARTGSCRPAARSGRSAPPARSARRTTPGRSRAA